MLMLLLDKSVLTHAYFVHTFGHCVHRRTFKAGNDGKGCDESSTSPPCTG